ncbi:Putative ribonuclease H protein At1g65750 [Linum perenne]
MGMSPPNPDRGEDVWVWGASSDGKFSIKSAYNLIHSQPESLAPVFWSSIWRWRGTKEVVNIAWDPGPIGWVTVNTDGSVNPQTRKAAAGGLLRDANGRCFHAFTMNLGVCSITRAELRGAIRGLEIAWDNGFRHVELQIDSMAVVALLNSQAATDHQHGMEIIQFRELRDRDWVLRVKHTYREGNHAADHHASRGYGYPFGSHTISTSCSSLGYFIRLDCIGISESRLVSIND